MKKLLFLPVLALGLVPFLSDAATYHYVNVEGETAAVEAPNAQAALVLAVDRHPNSGVAIDQGDIEPGMDVTAGVVAGANTSIFGTGGADTYMYVTQTGVTADVVAPNPTVALQIAPNIDENSGVVIDDGTLEEGVPVPNVD